jgi:hypothetical protein
MSGTSRPSRKSVASRNSQSANPGLGSQGAPAFYLPLFTQVPTCLTPLRSSVVCSR